MGALAAAAEAEAARTDQWAQKDRWSFHLPFVVAAAGEAMVATT